jgi:AcrR family transcriptional regulator
LTGADAQIEDVARHAGVGVGTVYRHFPTKQALLTELVRQTFRLFTERAREALEADGEPFAPIEGLLRGIAETAAEDVGVPCALASSDGQAWTEAQAEQDELIAVIAELIERSNSSAAMRNADRVGARPPGSPLKVVVTSVAFHRLRLGGYMGR